MTDMRALREAIAGLRTLLKQSADVPDEQFDAFRRHEVQLRRLIAEQNAIVASTGEAAFGAGSLGEAFRSQLSRLRHAIALHNGSWPVVLIDLESVEYLSSLQRMRGAYRDFFTWVDDNAG